MPIWKFSGSEIGGFIQQVILEKLDHPRSPKNCSPRMCSRNLLCMNVGAFEPSSTIETTKRTHTCPPSIATSNPKIFTRTGYGERANWLPPEYSVISHFWTSPRVRNRVGARNIKNVCQRKSLNWSQMIQYRMYITRRKMIAIWTILDVRTENMT